MHAPASLHLAAISPTSWAFNSGMRIVLAFTNRPDFVAIRIPLSWLCTTASAASRPETQAWVRELGAHHVVDHAQPFAPQLANIGFPAVDIVLALTGTAANAVQIAEVIAPEGHLGLIEGAAALGAFDPAALFTKSIGVHLELMFTRSMFGTPGMIEQHRLLTEIADLVDRGIIRTTLKQIIGPLDAVRVRGLVPIALDLTHPG